MSKPKYSYNLERFEQQYDPENDRVDRVTILEMVLIQHIEYLHERIDRVTEAVQMLADWARDE